MQFRICDITKRIHIGHWCGARDIDAYDAQAGSNVPFKQGVEFEKVNLKHRLDVFPLDVNNKRNAGLD